MKTFERDVDKNCGTWTKKDIYARAMQINAWELLEEVVKVYPISATTDALGQSTEHYGISAECLCESSFQNFWDPSNAEIDSALYLFSLPNL